MSEEEEGKRNNSSEDRSHYGELSRLSSKVDELVKDKENMDKKIKDLEERMTGLSVMTYHHSIEKRTTQMKWGGQGQPPEDDIRLQKIQEPKPIPGSPHSKSDSFEITPLSEDECSHDDSHDINKHTTRHLPLAPSSSVESVQGKSSKDQCSEDNNIIIIVGGGFGKDYVTYAGNKRESAPGGRDKDYESDKRPTVTGGRDEDNLGKGYADNMALVAGGRDKDHANVGYEDINQSTIPADGHDKDLLTNECEDYLALIEGALDKNYVTRGRGSDDSNRALVLVGSGNKETTNDADDINRNYGRNKLDDENIDAAYPNAGARQKSLVKHGPDDREDANKDDRHISRFNQDDEDEDEDEDEELRDMPNDAAIQRMQSKYAAAKEHAKKEGILNNDDDTDSGVGSQGKRDYVTSQGNKDYPLRSGSADYPIGQDNKDYPIGQVNRDSYPRGQGSRDYTTRQGSRDYTTRQGSRDYTTRQGSRDYPMGRGSREYPAGQGNKDYPTDQDIRDYPVGVGNKDIPGREGINRNDDRLNQDDDDMDRAIQSNRDHSVRQSDRDFLVDLANKDIHRKEDANRDDRFNQDDDMGGAISSQDKRDYATSQGNKDYPRGQGSRDYPTGQGIRDYPEDLDNKDIPRNDPSTGKIQRLSHRQDTENALSDDAASKMKGLETDDSKSVCSDLKAGIKCMCARMMKDDEEWKASVTILLELLVINAYSNKYPQSLIKALVDPSKRDAAVSEIITKMNPQVSPVRNTPITRLRTHPKSASTKDSSVVLVRANSRVLSIDGSKVKDHTSPVRSGSESHSNVAVGEGKRPSSYSRKSSQSRDKQIIPPGSKVKDHTTPVRSGSESHSSVTIGEGGKDDATTAKVSPASQSSGGTDAKTPVRCSTDSNKIKDKQTTVMGKLPFRYPIPIPFSLNKDKPTTPVGLGGKDGSAPPKVFAEFPPYPSALFDAKDPVPTSSQSNEKLSSNRHCQLVAPNTYVCPAPDKIDIICPPGSNPVIHIPSPSRSDGKQKKNDKSVSVSCCESGKPCPRHK